MFVVRDMGDRLWYSAAKVAPSLRDHDFAFCFQSDVFHGDGGSAIDQKTHKEKERWKQKGEIARVVWDRSAPRFLVK